MVIDGLLALGECDRLALGSLACRVELRLRTDLLPDQVPQTFDLVARQHQQLAFARQRLHVRLVTLHLRRHACHSLGEFGLALRELETRVALVEAHEHVTDSNLVAFDREHVHHVRRQTRGQLAGP